MNYWVYCRYLCFCFFFGLESIELIVQLIALARLVSEYQNMLGERSRLDTVNM